MKPRRKDDRKAKRRERERERDVSYANVAFAYENCWNE